MTTIKTVYEAVAAVATEITAVGKNARMDSGPAKYNYRSLDELVDTVHPLLAKHGVIFAPNGIEIIDRLEKTTKSGSIQYHIRAIVTYRVYGPGGDNFDVAVLSEGADVGDKSGNKLMSASLKYALGIVLSVPYSMDDQDAEIPEPARFQPTTVQDAHNRLIDLSAKIGKPVEQVTAKWREAHGGITQEQFNELPLAEVSQFVGALDAYVNSSNR